MPAGDQFQLWRRRQKRWRWRRRWRRQRRQSRWQHPPCWVINDKAGLVTGKHLNSPGLRWSCTWSKIRASLAIKSLKKAQVICLWARREQSSFAPHANRAEQFDSAYHLPHFICRARVFLIWANPGLFCLFFTAKLFTTIINKLGIQ